MRVLQGTPASAGIAIGPARLFTDLSSEVSRPPLVQTSPEGELARLKTACELAQEELHQIYEAARRRVGKDDSLIFQFHILMLQDKGFLNRIRDIIVKQKSSAEYAVWKTGRAMYETFSQMDAEYMRARSEDVLDISQRLLRCLNDAAQAKNLLSNPAVLCLPQALPSEVMQTRHSQILAFITQYGSSASHSAILARSLSKPAVVGLGAAFQELRNGSEIIVDGTKGQVILQPTPEVLEHYRRRMSRANSHRADLTAYKGTPAASSDGVCTHLYATANYPEDVDMALENDAEGIGLFRSEYLYGPDRPPKEETLLAVYRSLLQRMQGRLVNVRLQDFDSTTALAYFDFSPEANPALGCRSVRLSLRNQGLLRTQLRALLRASCFGQLHITVPLVNDMQTFQAVRGCLQEARAELRARGDPACEARPPLGVLLETPAGALQARELARAADFLFIGTNDLTQHTLAVDRDNPAVTAYYAPTHPAVRRLVSYIAHCARQAHKPLYVCGESAADYSMLRLFLRSHVAGLVVAAPYILELRREIQRSRVYPDPSEAKA